MSPYFKTLIFFLFLCQSVISFAQPHCKVLIFLHPDFCNNDMITLSALPFGSITQPVTYLWSTNETTETISVNNGPGTYSVTITDAVGCTATHSVTLDPAQLDYFIEAFNTCEGELMYLSINWLWLEEPFDVTYNWSNGQTTPTMTTTQPGLYSVTITDVNTNCNQVLSIDLQNSPAPDLEITGPTTICTGQTATLTATGNYLAVSWFPSGWSGSTFEITEPGEYIAMAVNEFNCSAYDTIVVLPAGTLPVLNGPFSLCQSGSVNIEVINNNEFSNFLWSTGATTSSINVNSAGIYSVVATDINGCTASAETEVTNIGFDIFELITNNTSCTSPNGSIDITVIPSGSYNYIWSNGATTEDISGLSSGLYTVTVSDQGNCTDVLSLSLIDAVDYPSINFDVIPETCNQNNGSLSLTVTPTGSYTYLWSNGANTPSIFSLSAGIYEVTVTNAQMCSATLSMEVPSTGTDYTIDYNQQNNTSCTNGNGSVDITITPTGSYTYLWSNGQTTEDLFGLNAGTFMLTVNDQNNCSSALSFTILDEFTTPEIDFITTNEICQQQNGSITALVSPISTYNYLWSDGSTTEIVDGLSAGTYQLTVTDLNQCTASGTVQIINEGLNINTASTISDNSHCSQPNGSIEINVFPAGTYDYLWSNGQTSPFIQNLSAGTYYVTITNPANCTQLDSFEVNDNYLIPVINYDITSPACNEANGSITTFIIPNGNYEYLWSNGSSNADLLNITSGLYSLTVTTINDCTSTAQMSVNNSGSSFTVSSMVVNRTDCITPNGFIETSVAPVGNYTFLWNTGAETPSIYGLDTGVYKLVIEDETGCTDVVNFTIANQWVLPNINSTTIPDTCSRSIAFIALWPATANANYLYQWSTGQNNDTLVGLSQGLYQVTVTTPLHCSIIDTFNVTNIDYTVSIQDTLTPNSDCLLPNGKIELTVTPVSNYYYLWNDGSNESSRDSLTTGSYFITITDVHQCETLDTFFVPDQKMYPMVNAQIAASFCNQNLGSIDLEVNNSSLPTFQWSTGANTEDLSNLYAGNYSVTITGENNCSTDSLFTVTNQNISFTVSEMIHPNSSCKSPNGSIHLQIVPQGNYQILWDNQSTDIYIDSLASGNYQVTITDETGCIEVKSFFVEETLNFISVNSEITPPACGKNSGEIHISSLPMYNYTFLWSDGSVDSLRTNLSSGQYTVTISNNYCDSNLNFILIDTTGLETISANVNHLTDCEVNNASIVLDNPSSGNDYHWSNGDTTAILQHLAPGMYYLDWTSDLGCPYRDSFVIEDQRVFPQYNLEIQNDTCHKNIGYIHILPDQPGYTFLWSNGHSEANLNNLGEGAYMVTITNALHCEVEQTFFILPIEENVEIIADVHNNTSCNHPNGEISLTILPQANYDISWSTGATGNVLNQLDEGIYDLQIITSGGCVHRDFYFLEKEVEPITYQLNLIQPRCIDETGGIEINSAAEDSLTIVWSDASIGPSHYELATGWHHVVIADPRGCSVQDSFYLEPLFQPLSIYADITHHQPCLNKNGRIEVVVTPTQNPDILWSNGQNSQIINDLKAGSYLLTLTDINGCTYVETYEVLHINDSLPINVYIMEPGCQGTSSGININNPISDNELDIYLNQSSLPWTDEFIPLNPGSYTLIAFNQQLCSDTISFIIPKLEEWKIASFSIELQNENHLLIHPQNFKTEDISELIWEDASLLSFSFTNLASLLNPELLDPSMETTYEANITLKNGCELRGSYTHTGSISGSILAPNIIKTSSFDNNIFYLSEIGNLVEIIEELQIFDRWGNLMFITKDILPNEKEAGWNGKYNNVDAEQGVYVWVAKLRYLNKSVKIHKGDLTLVR